MAYAFGYGHGMGFGFGFLNFIGTLLFIILVIWALKFLFRGGRVPNWNPRGWRGRDTTNDEAMTAVRERFARGEIDAAQFEKLRQGLSEGTDRYRSGSSWFDSGDSALELARMRFARGELTLEEFKTIRDGLTG